MSFIGFGKASIQSINSFQERFNVGLPEEYKNFLSTNNGGIFKELLFHVSELEEEIPMNVLYGLAVEEHFDLNTWNDEFKADLLPNSVIIGHDIGVGLIVLINDVGLEGIYFWDHTYVFSQSNDESNTYKIADNFTEFMNMCKNSQ